MKAATVEAICKVMDGTGTEYERRDSYSGRGMGSRTTVGIVVGDIGSFIGAVAQVAVDFAYSVASAGEEEDEGREAEAEAELERFTKDVSRVAIDSMGTDIIVY